MTDPIERDPEKTLADDEDDDQDDDDEPEHAILFGHSVERTRFWCVLNVRPFCQLEVASIPSADGRFSAWWKCNNAERPDARLVATFATAEEAALIAFHLGLQKLVQPPHQDEIPEDVAKAISQKMSDIERRLSHLDELRAAAQAAAARLSA